MSRVQKGLGVDQAPQFNERLYQKGFTSRVDTSQALPAHRPASHGLAWTKPTENVISVM